MSALQRPNAAGLILCRLLIVEEKTRNVTLVNSFQRMVVNSFPSGPVPFSVFTTLSDGLGDTMLELVVSRCDTLDEIYSRSFAVRFNDPLKQLRLWWQVRSWSFPVPGAYQFVLQADKEPITQCMLNVLTTGDDHG
jgi:hypothetical protein